MKIAKIIHKNLKLLSRSRGSIITTLIGPLLIIVLVGLAFGNITSYNINVGVYAPNYNDLTNSFVQKLEDQEFKIVKFPLQDLCINEIKKGTIHTCVFFPNNFDIGGNQSSTIEFYVDETNINVVSMVKEAVTKQVTSRMQELSEDLTEGILQKIDDVKVSAAEQTQMIATLIESGNAVSSGVSEVQSDLSDMDIDFNKNDLKLSTLDGLADDVYYDMEDIKDQGLDAVDRGLDLISAIRGLSPSPEISNELNDAEDDLEAMETSFNASSSMSSLLLQISNVSSLVSQLSTRLNTADATKNNIRDELTQIKQDIVKFQDDLQELQFTIDSMTGNVGDIKVQNAEGIVAPVKTLIKPVVAEKAPLHYMLPSLIVLVIMFISMLLAGTIVVMEKSSSAYFRNFVTPTGELTFLYGIFFTNLIVVSAQMLLVLLASLGVFKAAILSNFASIFLIVLLCISIYTVIGMIIGFLFNSQEIVSLGGISVGSLFLLMSNVIFPLEKMPSYMIKLAQYNPFILSESLLRKAMLFNTDIIYLMTDMFMLIFITIVLFIILFGISKFKTQLFLSGVHILKHGKKYATLDKEKLEELKKENIVEEKKSKKSKKEETVVEEPDYTEMDVPKKKGGFFRNLFKKTTMVFEEPKMLKEQVSEFVKKEDEKPKGKKKPEKKEKKKEEKKKPEKKEEKPKVKGFFEKIAAKKPKEESTNPLLSKLEPHQYFVLSSGNIVKSFKELVVMLKGMDDETFKYHVGKDKNDFYLWIKNVLKAEAVAKKIERIKDKKKMSAILKRFL